MFGSAVAFVALAMVPMTEVKDWKRSAEYPKRWIDTVPEAERSTLTFIGYEFRKVRDRLFWTGKRYLHFGPSAKSVKRGGRT